MGLLLSMLFHAALGGLCCYLARDWLELRGERLGIPLIMPMGATLVVGAPAAVYVFRFHGPFALHYLWDPTREAVFDTYSFPVSVGILALLALATAGGWVAVRRTVDLMHPPYCAAPAAGFVLVGLLLAGIFYRRSGFVTDMAGFAADDGVPLHQSPVGATLVVTVLAGALVALLTARVFRDDPRATVPPGRSTTLPPIQS